MDIEKRLYKGNGRITKHHRVSKYVYDEVWRIVNYVCKGRKYPKKLIRNIHRFVSHLYASSRLKAMDIDKFEKERGFVPVFSRLIESEFKRAFPIELLVSCGVIRVRGSKSGAGRCREFRLSEKFLSRVEIAERRIGLDFKKGRLPRMVNLINGDYVRDPLPSRLRIKKGDVIKDDIPQIVKTSVKSFKPCTVNLLSAYYEWIEPLMNKYRREKDAYLKQRKKLKKGTKEYKLLHREFLRHQGKFYNDYSCFMTILGQKPVEAGLKVGGVPLYKYEAAYKIQSSGRLSERGGGFQSASRVLKYFLLRGVTYYNYDLVSSQANILIQELANFGIQCVWLEEYVNDPKSKKIYARKVGVDVDTWKTCFYALFMGANTESPKTAIRKAIHDYHSNDRKTELSMEKFREAVRPLTGAIAEWKNAFYETKKKDYSSLRKGKRSWRNACRMPFENYHLIEKDGKSTLKKGVNSKKRGSWKRDLPAFFLQGREACFVHNLTVLCSREEAIPVFKNEHDGIITGEKIPEYLILEAGKAAGLKNASLTDKPICSEEEREAKLKYVNA